MLVHDAPPLAAGRRAAGWAQAYAVIFLLGALAGIAYFPPLTSILLVLSTFLFVIVARYSVRYLMGDPGQARFFFWLCLTSTFVFTLVLAPTLPIFVTAWCGISLSLHQLLEFYRERPGAVLAARKKFLVSRLGDVVLVAAMVLLYQTFGTLTFDDILRAAQQPPAGAPLDLICCLLVIAALLKSAQFPFHSWLPDTMETPTPVSALMHAGIINAGGILVLRFSSLISLSPLAMGILCVAGAFTALFASLVMLTQASIKRRLAFSTVAQMGFMMLECGLGAFHLALLHLVAHSLYKAHAFLTSGSAVVNPKRHQRPAPSLLTVAVCLITAVLITGLTAYALHVDPFAALPLHLIFSVAVAQMLWRLFAGRASNAAIPLGLLAAGGLSLAYFLLEGAAQNVVRPAGGPAPWLGLVIAGLLLTLAVAESQLPRLARTAIGERMYVHARNGFYCNTLANRLTLALFPPTFHKGEYLDGLECDFGG